MYPKESGRRTRVKLQEHNEHRHRDDGKTTATKNEERKGTGNGCQHNAEGIIAWLDALVMGV
jgi:hypothetical protein